MFGCMCWLYVLAASGVSLPPPSSPTNQGRLLGGLRGTGGTGQGEAAAVRNAMEALMQCLAKEGGCYVVPGIPPNQYQLTLICSVFGGFVAGYASRLEPQGLCPPLETFHTDSDEIRME